VTERFDQEVARATRLSASFAFLLFDVDHFKKVNDLHGHLTGDAVLRHVGAVLMANKRTEDVLARIGGDEFLLLLVGVHATANEAVVLADRLRLRVQDERLSHAGKDVTVTVSGGLAMYPGDGSTWEALFATADGRLYDSKNAGRNRLSGPS
jgi:diguanylate cyclase (GGDEF)-like protein